MSISYNMDGLELVITAGVSDEKLGKRRWTQVSASGLVLFRT